MIWEWVRLAARHVKMIGQKGDCYILGTRNVFEVKIQQRLDPVECLDLNPRFHDHIVLLTVRVYDAEPVVEDVLKLHRYVLEHPPVCLDVGDGVLEANELAINRAIDQELSPDELSANF